MAKRKGKATDKGKASKKASKKPATKRARATKPRKPTKAKPAPKRKPAPAKPRLSQSPAAKRARKYRRQKRRERLELESLELGERERQAELELAAERRRQGDERQPLIEILEYMRNTGSAHVPLSLEITEAEVGARIPWLVVGRFDCLEAPTYGELDAVFADWRDDLLLETRIHPQRLSQIRIVYDDPNSKRGEAQSFVSHTGPWEAVISEITFELDPDDEDSLANRYEHTTVPSFYVYFSGNLATEATISL